jgi:hypothetical protein
MKLLLQGTLLLFALTPLALQDEKHEETELGSHMEKIEDTLKLLRKNLKEPATYPAALDALFEIQHHSLQAKKLVPAHAAKLPEAERAAFVKEYKKEMIVLLRHQLELETALLDGNAEAAKVAFDKFREMEDPSHERFAPEDD